MSVANPAPNSRPRGTRRGFRAHLSRATRALLMAAALGAPVLASGDAAWAQAKPKVPEPPRPSKEDNDWPIGWNYLAMIVIIGLVVGANCIPSKRGHQD